MSEYELCKVCGETAYLEQSITGTGRFNLAKDQWVLYCSMACKYDDRWKATRTFGYILLALPVFVINLILSEPGFSAGDLLIIIIIFSWPAVGLLGFSKYQKNYKVRINSPAYKIRKQKREERRRRKLERRGRTPKRAEATFTPIPLNYEVESGENKEEDFQNDPQDQLIYSSILEADVHPCCHQSARLQDKYCACGRALEYPTEVRKQ